MPYGKLSDLPNSVGEHLPKHAQQIYRGAYNFAQEKYSEESCAHCVAWSAVENKYEKNEKGEWLPKEDR